MRYAIGLPNVGEFGDPRVLARLAVTAEEHGWDAVYLTDHVLYHEPGWPVANPVVAAAAVAALTRRLRLVVMWVLPRRRVAVVAREAASLDALSGGRLTLISSIGSMDIEYSGFGDDPDLRARGRALDASLTDLRALWSGEPVVVAGGAGAVTMGPPAAIPVWCSGRWPNRRPLRRAARYDGVMPTFVDQRSRVVPPGEFAAATAYVAGERGGLDGFDVALEGASPPGAAAEVARSYVDGGLTWWVEAFGHWRGGLAEAETRIAAGP